MRDGAIGLGGRGHVLVVVTETLILLGAALLVLGFVLGGRGGLRRGGSGLVWAGGRGVPGGDGLQAADDEGEIRWACRRTV
jgi:hypothetical protein